MSRAQTEIHVSLSFKERHVLCCIAKRGDTFGTPLFSVAEVTDSVFQFFDLGGRLTHYLCGDDAQEEVLQKFQAEAASVAHHLPHFAFFDGVLSHLNLTDEDDIFETCCTSTRWTLPRENHPPASKIVVLLQNLVRYVFDSAATSSYESCSLSTSDTYRVTCIVSAVLSMTSHVLLRYSVAKALGKLLTKEML